MSDEERDRLEGEIPALAVEAGRQAHAAALEVGSVLVLQDSAVVEVFRDGRNVVVKSMPPQVPARAGETMQARR